MTAQNVLIVSFAHNCGCRLLSHFMCLHNQPLNVLKTSIMLILRMIIYDNEFILWQYLIIVFINIFNLRINCNSVFRLQLLTTSNIF